MNLEAISKEISYALRHNPQQYDLTLDEQGWVSVVALISALNRHGRFKSLSISGIEKMILVSEKKRHEIQNGKIRALYGHSTIEKIEKEPLKPPDVLYHGTTHKYVDSIFVIGLISKNRQYVHLSGDVNTAITVGKRKDDNPIILIIYAKQAWDDGVSFYLGNENIWLADGVPSKYIGILSSYKQA